MRPDVLLELRARVESIGIASYRRQFKYERAELSEATADIVPPVAIRLRGIEHGEHDEHVEDDIAERRRLPHTRRGR